MKQIYIYPNTKSSGPLKSNTGSPYIRYLMDSLRINYHILNEEDITTHGIFNLIKYLKRVDYLILNWIENIPDRRFGYIQFILFLIIQFGIKFSRIKTIWILHNKLSHDKKNILLKKIIFKTLLKNCDLIITHASEGIEYVKSISNFNLNKIKFIHHPMMKTIKDNNLKQEYDIIIWGTIKPYKGVQEFLEYASRTNLVEGIKILIAGKIYPDEFAKQFMKYKSNQIHFINRFIPDNELDDLIAKSKIILFTYNEDSILSSAALMDSLVYINKIIIGPHTGSFADLSYEGLVYTYKNFKELNILLRDIVNLKTNIEKKKSFINDNTWVKFGKTVLQWIDV